MTGNTLAAVAAMSLFSYVLMAVIAMTTAAAIAALVAGLAAVDRRRTVAAEPAAGTPVVPASPAVPAPPAASGLDPAVVAAISAAIQTVAGGHRIVWIGEAQPSGGWVGEVRAQHHGSHHPHHDR